MSIALAEQLKKEWTDKYVVVDEGSPELKRFSGLTGTVRTINMNGRALVEFDGAVDIGWYDIDPSYLKVIPEPLKKKAPATPAKAAPAEAKAAPAAPKPAAPKPDGEKKLSPLELARQQGAAAKAAGDAPKKPSPLEMARQQGAAKVEAAAAAPVAEPAAVEPALKPAAAGSTREKPGSTAEIIELARRQGAMKR